MKTIIGRALAVFFVLSLHAAFAQVPPTSTASNPTATVGTSIPAANLLTTTSTYPIVNYEIWQSTAGTGNFFYVNGVQQAARTDYVLTAAQWAQTVFTVNYNGTEPNIAIRVQDSQGNWSYPASGYWTLISVTGTAGGPVLSMPSGTMPQYTEFDLSQMFTATLDQGRAITQYQAISSAGNLIVGGARGAPGATVTITPTQMTTALVETTNVNDAIQIRAYDGTNWGPWATANITLSNVYGPHVYQPTAGWGEIDCNIGATATATTPIPPTRRVLVDWTNNLGRPIQIVRVAASLGLPMSTPNPVGQYVYAVQVIRADGSGTQTIYPGGAQNYSAADSASLPWNDVRDFPDPGFVVQPNDKLHFLIDGYTTGADFNWQVDFQVFFR